MTVLENEALAWRLERDGDTLRSAEFANKLTGSTFTLADAEELALVFSSGPDRIAEPLVRVADFTIVGFSASGTTAEATLRSAWASVEATLHYQLDGATRRKWADVRNVGGAPRLLLDIQLDAFGVEAQTEGGGMGQPLFLGGEAWAAVEYPSGENACAEGRVTLTHFPGRLLQPGEGITSHAALVSVAETGRALESFVEYLQAHALRKPQALSIYTPFGTNNQWGLCSTLTDEETLHVLDVLEQWQQRGVRFDYFTLDTGWVDPSSDLTRFRPTCYPNGPDAVTERVHELGMRFGLWFATSWAAESCWDYPPAWEGQTKPTMGWLNGVPAKAHYAGSFCFACEPYVSLVREAALHHVRHNRVRFLKFDGGSYACDNPDHDHLPGRYSTERMYGNLIEIAEAVRREAPDTFVMWYWGLRSPFWALHGDSIFESGLHMEGSGTSSTPTLHYRDSVTLAQDQNAQHARNIPPLVKDSLGVWLAHTRWGNFMGRERWREALVMDLGRGSLLFPNLWGDPHLLDEDDVDFLAWISQLAKERAGQFLHRRSILGDPWKNEVYAYAHGDGSHAFLFLSNAHFAARKAEVRLDVSIGLTAERGSALRLIAHFPERAELAAPNGAVYAVGDRCELWLRPFEVLMLEAMPDGEGPHGLPIRSLSAPEVQDLGIELPLRFAEPTPELSAQFVQEAQFEAAGYVRKTYAFETRLPGLEGPQPVLAIPIRLRESEAEWRYSPVVAEVVQARVRVGDENLFLVPVPDARQFGNTQKAGCSWVVYNVRLSPRWSGAAARVEVHAWLPPNVEALSEAWVVKRWWQADTRPAPDGYYGDAPS